uniref:Uncharacterized protein n=1 Tax=Setaria italica TaxID=4555 RepID=K3ZB76_SETIT
MFYAAASASSFCYFLFKLVKAHVFPKADALELDPFDSTWVCLLLTCGAAGADSRSRRGVGPWGWGGRLSRPGVRAAAAFPASACLRRCQD